MSRSVIVAGARTPIGKFRGAFAGLSAVDLGAIAIGEALMRSGVAADQVDYVVMGQVIRAGTGQITARQAAIAAGIPKEVPALNVDKVCLSGTTAIALADQMIRAGEVDLVVAGGMESMTQAPYVVPSAREGSRLGHTEMIDTMIHDGLWSTLTRQVMGESSDAVNAELGIGREELVNVNGGAVALGHPIGASGARLVLSLAHELRRRGVDLGGVAICGGGGQGDALVIRRR